MEYLELITELLPMVLSILATVFAFKKGKKTLTVEEIEEQAEKKKQIYIAKKMRKVKTPSKVEEVEVTSKNAETGIETLI